MIDHHGLPPGQGFYDPANEHDACGVGFVAHIKGKKSTRSSSRACTILKNLTHRGAVGADPLASRRRRAADPDPRSLLPRGDGEAGREAAAAGEYGVGMVFLPRDPASRLACEYEIERAIKDEGQVLLGWRDVPVDNPTSPIRRSGSSRSSARFSSAAAPASRSPMRSSASSTSSARAPAMRSRRSSSRTARSSMCRRCRRAPSSTRACCSPPRSAPTTRT